MSLIIKISPQANADIEDIHNYILKDGQSIATEQVKLIYSALENLSLFPNIGTDLSKRISQKTDYKYIVINKIYLAFYTVNDSAVQIYRVIRGEQDYIKILGLN